MNIEPTTCAHLGAGRFVQGRIPFTLCFGVADDTFVVAVTSILASRPSNSAAAVRDGVDLRVSEPDELPIGAGEVWPSDQGIARPRAVPIERLSRSGASNWPAVSCDPRNDCSLRAVRGCAGKVMTEITA